MRLACVSFVAAIALGCATADEPDASSTDASTHHDGSSTDSGDGDGAIFEAEPPVDGGCPSGGTLCGMLCVPTASDVDNCGGCGNKCPDVTNATRTCVLSTCGHSCNEGFAQCAGDMGCDTDLFSNPAHCGSCTTTCPSSPTTDATCTSKTCGTKCKTDFVSLGGACTNFGGAFETAGCGSCSNGNPYASGTCACPTGTTPSPAMRARTDACGSLTGATIQVCESAGAAVSAWGGAYQNDDGVGGGAGCRVPNGKTGSCTCPAGYSAVNLRVLIVGDTGTVIGSTIGVCTHPSVADAFAGAYQVDDAVPGGVGCRAANPQTGGCSCPGGYTATPVRTLVDSSKGEIGAQAFFCTK